MFEKTWQACRCEQIEVQLPPFELLQFFFSPVIISLGVRGLNLETFNSWSSSLDRGVSPSSLNQSFIGRPSFWKLRKRRKDEGNKHMTSTELNSCTGQVELKHNIDHKSETRRKNTLAGVLCFISLAKITLQPYILKIATKLQKERFKNPIGQSPHKFVRCSHYKYLLYHACLGMKPKQSAVCTEEKSSSQFWWRTNSTQVFEV